LPKPKIADQTTRLTIIFDARVVQALKNLCTSETKSRSASDKIREIVDDYLKANSIALPEQQLDFFEEM